MSLRVPACTCRRTQDQKRVSDPLKQELQIVECNSVGTVNKLTQPCFQHLSMGFSVYISIYPRVDLVSLSSSKHTMTHNNNNIIAIVTCFLLLLLQNVS